MRLAVASLAFVDYLLSYVGIKIGAAAEANILMVWFMELPFWLGALLRLGYVCFLVAGMTLIKHAYPARYLRTALVLFIIQLIPLLLHIFWIGVALG